MSVKLRIQGLKIKFGGPATAGWLPPNAGVPEEQMATVSLWIEETPEGFFLNSESDHPNFSGGDSWHRTLDDAIHQAELQFGIHSQDWKAES